MAHLAVNGSAIAWARNIGAELVEIDRAFWSIYRSGQDNPQFAAHELVSHCRKLLKAAEMLRFSINEYAEPIEKKPLDNSRAHA